MKLILKKFIIIVLIIFILLSSLFSGFVLADDLTQERAGNYASSFAINFYDNWSSISYELINGAAYNGSYNGKVIELAEKIFMENIFGRNDVQYNASGGLSSDIVVNHPEKLTGIDCSGYVSAVLWAAGYEKFSVEHGTATMLSGCENGTYASYGLEIYKNDNQIIKKWDGSEFVEVATDEKGLDFLKPGDAVLLRGYTPSGTFRHHTHIFVEKIDDNSYKSLDCGGKSNWTGSQPYMTSDNLWQYSGSYVIRAPGNGDSTGVSGSSSIGSSFKKKAIKRGEIATKYDENAKLENIIEDDKETYIFNNEVWINFVYKNALSMSETTLADLLKNFDTEDEIFKDELVKSGDIIDISKLVNEGKIVPGDILYAADGKGGVEYLLYVGGTKVLYATPPNDGETEEETEESKEDSKDSAIRYDYLQYYIEDLRKDLLVGHEEEEDYEIPQYGITKIYRIKQTYLDNNSIIPNMIFNKKGYFTYDKYEGSPSGQAIALNPTEDVNVFKWIFDGIVGIFEFLLNTIFYAVRMQVIGFVNMTELALQSIILGLSGNANTQMVSNFFGPDATAATGGRISVESIFFNQIPILDANFFNFKSAGGYSLENTTMYQPATASGMGAYEITQPDESNIVYQLRYNLRRWYVVVRNLSIAILLFVLIFLGIKYAISTTGEKKADIKSMLASWCVAFIIVLFIHIFMYMVFQINDALVGACKDIGQNIASVELDEQNTQEMNLYDAVRVKSYAFDFKEGIPATVIYIYLIYLLIRFSYIYLKRYITIYVLAIMGSFMGVKYAYEKIMGKKTTSLGKWFKDFSFNVLLQTVHAFIYVIYMGIAIKSASESLAGFLLCLIILNFMLNADKIIIKIFGLDKASSLSDVIKPESYLNLVAKFTPMLMISKNVVGQVGNFLFGKRGLVREAQYSLKGFDNYKDADKYFEDLKYTRIGKMQQFNDKILGKMQLLSDNIKSSIAKTKLGKIVTDKGISINEMLKNRGLKGFSFKIKPRKIC